MKQIDQQRERALQTDGSPAALFNLFVQITRDQLHIVVTMSPIGDAFRNRIRKFPALVNCCTIDWLQVYFMQNTLTEVCFINGKEKTFSKININKCKMISIYCM